MSRQRTRAALSQNFLRDPRLADHLVRLAALDANDTVIEIGPGSGVLTGRLAQSCRQVLAIEKDANLARRLTQRFASERAVATFAADFLEFPLPGSRYKVFANIPFAITTAIVSKLTTGVSPPEDAWLVIQREAAQRFLGEPDGTLVSALLHPWFTGQIRHDFRRSDFVPQPGVDVVLLQMSQRPEPFIAQESQEAYRDLVTFAYTAWQPTVAAALATAMPAAQVARLSRIAASNLERRPSALTGEEWIALVVATHDLFPTLPAAIAGAAGRLEQRQATLAKQHRSRRSFSSSSGGDWRGR
ncbi:MAG: 23S ribosomal RNA methyltransferase Erm [Chloroflexota bacterium]|nr:23S ribosomal RNA methyltransferase Erm [Chloroflexota bacterium]